MKKNIRLTMVICLSIAVTSLYAIPSEKQFDGEWASHKGLDFGIHLHQNGNRLTGYHSITATIKGDTAIVEVHSAYSDAVLKVRLTLHDRSLDWKVLEVKQSGEYYIPEKATLMRAQKQQ